MSKTTNPLLIAINAIYPRNTFNLRGRVFTSVYKTGRCRVKFWACTARLRNLESQLLEHGFTDVELTQTHGGQFHRSPYPSITITAKPCQ